jgi:hypothetical protein
MTTVNALKIAITGGGGLARTNKFMVSLPSIGGGSAGILGAITGSLGQAQRNVLCTNATLPGKQILTHDRRIGIEQQKVSYGYAMSEVSLTFVETSSLPIRNYFESWISTIHDTSPGNQDKNVVNYPTEYKKRVTIHQLASPIPTLGFAGGLDLNVSTYSCALVDAFPTTIGDIAYSNDLDGYVTFSVQLSYRFWERVPAGQLSLGIGF